MLPLTISAEISTEISTEICTEISTEISTERCSRSRLLIFHALLATELILEAVAQTEVALHTTGLIAHVVLDDVFVGVADHGSDPKLAYDP